MVHIPNPKTVCVKKGMRFSQVDHRIQLDNPRIVLRKPQTHLYPNSLRNVHPWDFTSMSS